MTDSIIRNYFFLRKILAILIVILVFNCSVTRSVFVGSFVLVVVALMLMT